MLIISKGQKLVEMHQDKPNQVYEGTCIHASNPMLCIVWNAVSSYTWFCVLHSTICQISDQSLSKKMCVALHSQAHDTENERGEKKTHLTSSWVSERKCELTPMMKGVGVLSTSSSFPGKMGTYVKLERVGKVMDEVEMETRLGGTELILSD